jgi:hypothetical protein
MSFNGNIKQNAEQTRRGCIIVKKKISIGYLNLSVAITLLSAYIIPCHLIDDFRKSFGFPFGWFTVYGDTIGNTILTSTSLHLHLLIANITIWYLVILFAHKAYRKLKYKSESDSPVSQ